VSIGFLSNSSLAPGPMPCHRFSWGRKEQPRSKTIVGPRQVPNLLTDLLVPRCLPVDFRGTEVTSIENHPLPKAGVWASILHDLPQRLAAIVLIWPGECHMAKFPT
jgi:hypothetical protein